MWSVSLAEVTVTLIAFARSPLQHPLLTTHTLPFTIARDKRWEENHQLRWKNVGFGDGQTPKKLSFASVSDTLTTLHMTRIKNEKYVTHQ